MVSMELLVYIVIIGQIAVLHQALAQLVPRLGGGYSSDSESIAAGLCYKCANTSQNPNTIYGAVNFNKAMSSKMLADTLGVSGELSVNLKVFTVDAKESYVDDNKETQTSISFNYVAKSSQTSFCLPDGSGEDVLNDLGKSVYQKGQNPYFGFSCGDQMITSVQTGTILAMSVNVKLSSVEDKNKIQGDVKGLIGKEIKLASAGAELEKVSTTHNVTGEIVFSGYQMGGDPTQLGKILTTKVVVCKLQNMEPCYQVLEGMIEYSNKFMEQAKDKSSWSVLGTDFMTLSDSVTLDLQWKSHFTPKIAKIKNKIRKDLVKHSMYRKKLKAYNYHKPDPWTTYIEAINLLEKIENNIDILKKIGMNCLKSPGQCEAIESEMGEDIEKITDADEEMVNKITEMVTAAGSS